MILSSKGQSIFVAAKPANRYGAYRSEPYYSNAGNVVTPETAMGIPAVLGAITMISNSIASMRLQILDRNSPRGNNIVSRGAMVAMLQHQPNSDMTGVDFWSYIAASLTGRGNAYAAKIRNAKGDVTELYPIPAQHVTPYRDDKNRKLFRVRIYEGTSFVDQDFDEQSIIHFKGDSILGDPLVGDSPISIQRHMLGSQLAQIDYQAANYSNGMMIKGILSVPDRLPAETAALLKDAWRQNYGGVNSAGDVAVLSDGANFQAVSLSPEDAQFIQTRRWGNTEVAQIFQIPSSRLNGESSTGTYQNQSQDDLFYYSQAVMPRVRRIEAALNMDKDLFGALSAWEPRFNENDILRADIKTRYEVHRIGREIGVLSANDIRDSEDMAAIDGGDDYTPLNTGGSGGNVDSIDAGKAGA